ncbi:MAG: DUF58 domain-containing protein [Lachnospiraceae bacterium]|nr:DUF58 domain-containing protein [Lachnospiraceae bacterium]
MCSFIILGVSILATGYLAMMYENMEFMLLVYLQATLFLLSFFFVWFRKLTIRGTIETPVGIAEPGKESLVKMVITNKGFLPMARMKALLVTEDLCTGKKKKQWMRLPEIPRGEEAFLRMLSFDGTGTYRLSLKKMRVYDVTGLFYGNIRGKSKTQIQVLPKLYDIPVRLSLAVRNFYGEADVYDEHVPGHDNSEIFQVREYRKGDRLQNIHWKLTAKQDDIMVKENSLPKACPVILFLEYCPKKHKKKQQRVIPFLEAAASLSFSVMDAGCPHYVVWYDEAEQDIVRIRVDNEESLFVFLGMLMRVRWKRPKEAMRLRYREKYRMEPYVWALSLNERLVLKKEDEVLAELSAKETEQSLAQIELVL